MSATYSRRSVLRASAAALAVGTLGAAATTIPRAHAADRAPGQVLGTVIDFAAAVPSAAAIKAAGHLGAVRYVSAARPGAEWMKGKPVTLTETQANAALGLKTASIYQYGRDTTADWLAGAAGAAVHAPQAIALHKAAGGPTGRPIYIAIDDNPTRAQYEGQIRPYLRAFSAALSTAGYSTGVYGNYNVIDWAVADGIGQFFWMHDWGSGGKIHPHTTIHQLPKAAQRTIDGVVVDINEVYAADWGQWAPGQPGDTAPAGQPATSQTPAGGQQAGNQLDALGQLSSELKSRVPGMPDLPQVSNGGISYNGSSVSGDQLRQAADLVSTVQKAMK